MLDSGLADENGLLENAQVLVLLVATVVFFARTRVLYREKDHGLLAYCLFIVNVPFIGAGRELNFGAELGADEQTVLIVQVVMGCIAILLLASALGLFFGFVDEKPAGIWRLLSHPTSLHIYVAILVFGLSSAFEQGGLNLPQSELLEEVFELGAFGIVLRAAWVLRPDSQAT